MWLKRRPDKGGEAGLTYILLNDKAKAATDIARGQICVRTWAHRVGLGSLVFSHVFGGGFFQRNNFEWVGKGQRRTMSRSYPPWENYRARATRTTASGFK
jgi:hypothetical protein